MRLIWLFMLGINAWKGPARQSLALQKNGVAMLIFEWQTSERRHRLMEKIKKYVVLTNVFIELLLLYLFFNQKLLIPALILLFFMAIYHIKKFNKFLRKDAEIYFGDMISLEEYNARMNSGNSTLPIKLSFHVVVLIFLLLFLTGIILLLRSGLGYPVG